MNSLNIFIIILDLFILSSLFYYLRKLVITFKEIVYYLQIERNINDQSKTFNDSDFSISNRSLLQIMRGKGEEQSTLNTNEEKRNFLLIHCSRVISNYHYVARIIKNKNLNSDKYINNELQILNFAFCIFNVMQLSIFLLSIKDDVSIPIIISIIFCLIHLLYNYSLVFIFTKMTIKISANDFGFNVEIYLIFGLLFIFGSFVIGLFLIIFDQNINIQGFLIYFVIGFSVEIFLRFLFLIVGLMILLIYLKLAKKDLSLYFKDEIEQENQKYNFNSFIKCMKRQITIQKELENKQRINKLIHRKLNTVTNNDLEKKEIKWQRSFIHIKDDLLPIRELQYTCLDLPSKENNKKKAIKSLQAKDLLVERQKEYQMNIISLIYFNS